MKIFLTCFFLELAFVQAYSQNFPGKFPFASSRLLVPADVEDLQMSDLRIMRNEIFARYGHTFKSEDLKEYFANQDWYVPAVTDATPLLSDLEKKNIEFIQLWENRLAHTGNFEDFFELFSAAVRSRDIKKLTGLAHPDFLSAEEWESGLRNLADEIEEAIDTAYPGGDEETKTLWYGEYYLGVQYQSIEFQKRACCWYIYALRKAG
jgi:hypothetical protein